MILTQFTVKGVKSRGSFVNPAGFYRHSHGSLILKIILECFSCGKIQQIQLPYFNHRSTLISSFDIFTRLEYYSAFNQITNTSKTFLSHSKSTRCRILLIPFEIGNFQKPHQTKELGVLWLIIIIYNKWKRLVTVICQ